MLYFDFPQNWFSMTGMPGWFYHRESVIYVVFMVLLFERISIIDGIGGWGGGQGARDPLLWRNVTFLCKIFCAGWVANFVLQ